MSDTSAFGFGQFVPGFDFLQNLAKSTSGQTSSGGTVPGMSSWVAPTLSVQELDKRIQELKAVQFWLEQNARALAATVQALEVQKMTLATLKGMNFSLGDVANALKIKAADTVAGVASGVANTANSVAGRTPTQFAGLEIPPSAYHAQAPAVQVEAPAPEPVPEPEPAPEPAPRKASAKKAKAPSAEAPAMPGVVDPMQWWGALSQQFQTIAGNALKDAAKQSSLDVTRNVASGLTGEAMKAATGMAGNVAKTVSDTVGAAAALGKAVTGVGGRGRGNALKSAAWPIPGAVSPEVTPPAAKKPARKSAAKKAPAKKAATRKRAG